jgi:hypothetical protein
MMIERLLVVSCHEVLSAVVMKKLKLKLRPTVSRPVYRGVELPAGTRDQIFFLY